MHLSYRQTFFTIFAVVYIILLPFLIIFSLGYDLDFKNKTFNNTLSIRIETYPRNALVPTQSETFKTPTDLRTEDGKELTLDVNLEGYQSESYTFKSLPGTNASAKIQSLWLLPQKEDQRINYSGSKFISVLDDRNLIYSRGDNYYIQGYGFSGLQGNQEQISIEKSDRKLTEGRWEILLDDAYWQKEQEFMLFKRSEKWSLLDLKNYPFKVRSAARVSPTQFLLLDSEKNIWSLNTKDLSYEFVDTGFVGMAFTDSPDMIWLLDNKKIYRLLRSSQNFLPTDLRTGVYAENSIIADLTSNLNTDKYNNFVAKSLFLGLIFKINDRVLYIQDSNKSIWQVIASNVQAVGTNNSTMFWIDSQKSLYSYNLLLKNQVSFGKIDLESDYISNYNLSYFVRWKRLLIYTDKQIASTWFDTEIVNESIIRYYPKKWIVDKFCYAKIIDNYQFCAQDDNFIIYKNNSIPF
jgi:hypothetical protein